VRRVEPTQASDANVETSSTGDSGPVSTPAGVLHAGLPAVVGQARKRAAHRWTPVARWIAGWRRHPRFPVSGTPGNLGFVRYSYRFCS